MGHSHFKGKSVFEHLKEARARGKRASQEHHGIEPSGLMIAASDAAKETALYSLLIWTIGSFLGEKKLFFFTSIFLVGLFLWKVGRSAILGWARLERVTKLIDDERKEIVFNREEERRELTEIYAIKGFAPPLLDKVIDVLMADDNKLLGIMLEEELGISLEEEEHPLKIALGSGIGVVIASLIFAGGAFFAPMYGVFIAAYLTVLGASYIMARTEGVEPLTALVWNGALLFLASLSVYFLTALIGPLL